MKNITRWLFTVVLLSFSTLLFSQQDTLILRSEFEKAGDEIYDLDDVNEGSITYSIISGNDSLFYGINSTTGVISISNVIPDTFNVVRMDTLVIDASGNQYTVRIVDGYDFIIQNLDHTYHVLDEHSETYIDSSNEWTAFNNLWGRGTAVPNVDFRIATIHKSNLPDSTILIWDTPSKAREYGGASVWCYHNIFYGNRKNTREDLSLFPFQISTLDSLSIDFEFEQLFGDDQYKIAMNMFMTDESYLTSFSKNDGDFFFVFDQKGTWIPPYPYALPDSTILGKLFALRYHDEHKGAFYERRRVIVKNHQKLLQGVLDINHLFTRFADEGWLDLNQYIYHLQLGIEVTEGYGAVRINKSDIHLSQTSQAIPVSVSDGSSSSSEVASIDAGKPNAYPIPADRFLFVQGRTEDMNHITLFNLLGEKIVTETNPLANGTVCMDVSTLKPGIYILKTKTATRKVQISHTP